MAELVNTLFVQLCALAKDHSFAYPQGKLRQLDRLEPFNQLNLATG